MLSGKYVNIEFVIERLQDDYDFIDECNKHEIIEWIWRAISRIGVSNALVQKITDGEENNDDPISVENYRAILPVDLHTLESIIDYNTNIPLICVDTPILKGFYTGSIEQYTYNIGKDYIYTDMEEGNFIFVYRAFPVDNRKYPLIADDERYISAVVCFVAERICYRMWFQGRLDERRYKSVEQDWLFYVNSARTKALMPNYNMMEGIKKKQVRLLPLQNLHDGSFTGGNKDESLNAM